MPVAISHSSSCVNQKCLQTFIAKCFLVGKTLPVENHWDKGISLIFKMAGQYSEYGSHHGSSTYLSAVGHLGYFPFITI